MKKRLLSALLALVIVAQGAAALEPSAPPLLAPLQQQAQAANITAQIFERFHYKATPLNQAMSEKIFDRYLAALDSDKLFFVQADIDRFAGARAKLGEAITRQDLRVPFEMFNLYKQRVAERLAFARELLDKDFDFGGNESYQFERNKAPWPKSDEDVRDLWRKRVKNDWLRLKLAGKEDKFIRSTLDKRYSNSLARTYKSKSEDVFQIFMNAYATSVEPHTVYLGPRASEEFEIAMSLSLVGIGAVLQQRDEYTTIRELMPNGPAALCAKLHVGDRIVGVAQGKDGAITDVVGWRVDDVVKLVRGSKDSVVRLDILPADAGPDGKHTSINLVRDKVTLEQQGARKSVIQVKDGAATHQVGVISLPTFYQDVDARSKGAKDYKSATRDVARLLDELKRDKVDGVLVDLRNNGGGSLDEAVELTALFTGEGPVVQQRNSRGEVKVESGINSKLAWGGPLGVLINRGSASASEIFAAAIQDYGRGIIIGEPSYGKGTVQTMVNLDQAAHNDKPKFGGLKVTTAQFFRVNGGTTQLRGVTPDIGFPAISDADNFGESSFDNALPWTQIKAANYTPVGDLSGLLPVLQSRHASRIAQDKDFQFLLEDIAEARLQRRKQVVSLNEAERRKERETRQTRLKVRAEIGEIDGNSKRRGSESGNTAAVKMAALALQDSGLQSDERSLSDELAAESARKEARDAWLNEAAHILRDEADLLKATTKLLAERATPGRQQSWW